MRMQPGMQIEMRPGDGKIPVLTGQDEKISQPWNGFIPAVESSKALFLLGIVNKPPDFFRLCQY
jgi:hypothetical protein